MAAIQLSSKRTGRTWALEEAPPSTAWSKVMQFKSDGHLVSSTKSDVGWDRWVTARRGETVKLLIYEYGMAVVKTKDLTDFMADCIQPPEVDRSGATAESSLRDVVAQLQDIWGTTFQAHGTVWRMWAKEITRNLDRSTWETAVLDNPPNHVLCLLKQADTQVDRQLSGLTMSAQLALDCVNASIADNEQLKQDCDALRQRLDSQATSLTSRKLIIEAFLADIPPLSVSEDLDPFDHMENVDGEEHQE
ncbi:hypothetical protein ON010_g16624 [Phytophthora cinnamomi]|nr:hypothetical protein ON010_g16624 [Phytophthora cinnamomi]